MNSQIQLTTIRIGAAQTKINLLLNEIAQLENEVVRLEGVLNNRLALLMKRIPASYKRSSISQFGTILFSKNIFDFVTRIKYVAAVQRDDAAAVLKVKSAQNSFNESKQVREGKTVQLEETKSKLQQENKHLTQQKQEKDALLSQTKGQEATYQQLLAQARKLLAGFASFADSQGATLLSGQTTCSDWGCYYNQRDTQWGNAIINGQSSGCNGPCSVLRVGCLITSVAMLASHYGHRDITPQDVAFSSPANYSVGTALLMRGTIYVKGVSINRSSVGSRLSPDVVSGGPVIVGVYSGPFGTHFVVVKSYTDGKYIMNDPYVENGSDKSFTDYYSLNSVFEVDRVSM
ncbi:hypothetical protein A2363_03115 [Candidatus Gottesmanbacteria bacterium RIFOXYB1_FULL_47_11]|uniref:Peptidase C39-like domain-containing protein n=1 Tax=Candidatus Gottesmanbacteria bacterium RIFOXYB1_FULL_47_11 TaxID=1798401 RepID=A0A1F6BFL9_9BACT|nr:MAG: hypothetical protein A2363_03115 [Candidatus Gottesmanbacteria bacterium RIFOXYB1_FULL_47_11]